MNTSLLLLGQAPANRLLTAIIFTLVSLPLGVVTGYLWAYRFKRQYVRVARELANLRGENFRGELSTVGFPRGATPARGPVLTSDSTDADIDDAQRRWREQVVGLTADRDRLATELTACRKQFEQQRLEAERAVEDASNASSAMASTDQWQLDQLHQEQISMQLKVDDYRQQIEELTRQRDQCQSGLKSAADEFERLRNILAQQEAVIASIERERDSLATRVVELERRPQQPT